MDTPPEIADLVRSKLMARSGTERFIMGAQMFDAVRRKALASLPAGLPPEELKRQIFQRIYGHPCALLSGSCKCAGERQSKKKAGRIWK